MAEAGRPTELNDELCLKIRALVLEGKKVNEILQIIAEESENQIVIDKKTFEGWIGRNYKGFADKWLSYKHERRLQKAEENIDEILEMSTINVEATKIGFGEETEYEPNEFQDPRLIKIKADTSLFVAETLGKKSYSKRSELTGAEGKELQFKWIDDDTHNSVQTEKVGEGVSPESEAVDSASVAPESGQDDCDP